MKTPISLLHPLFGFIFVCLLSACSTNRPKYLEPVSIPGFHLGPSIDLVSTSTVRDKVRVVADRNHAAHVIIASSELRQVEEVIVPHSGTIQRRTIKLNFVPWSVDAAFDRQGRLHVLLDSEHMVLDEGIWKNSDHTPWQSAGLKAYSPRFVPGAPTLTWSFQIDGKDVGSPSRVEVYGFGGYGGGIIWPMVTYGLHTVLVSEAQNDYGPWVIIEPKAKEDTSIYDIASDGEGNLFLIYTRSRDGFAAERSNHFVRVSAHLLQGNNDIASHKSDSRHPSDHFISVAGQQIKDQFIVRDQAPSGPVIISKPRGFYRDSSRLSSDTGSTLHAMSIGQGLDEWLGKDYPVRYQRFSHDAWSSPMTIGFANVSTFWGNIWNAFDISSVGPNSAFVVWPTEKAIVGRWIEHAP